MQDSFDDIAKFKAVLADQGVPGALAFLNRSGGQPPADDDSLPG